MSSETKASKPAPPSPHPGTVTQSIASTRVVDENGSRIEVPDTKTVKPATPLEEAVGATGPTNWWRIALIVLAVLIFGVLVIQFLTGGSATPTG